MLPILRQEAPWHRLTCKLDSWALKTGKVQARGPLSLSAPQALQLSCVQAGSGRAPKGVPESSTPAVWLAPSEAFSTGCLRSLDPIQLSVRKMAKGKEKEESQTLHSVAMDTV